ncbi:hypothetical protein, partial [Promineifilum sp.]|uniref:hypothetical protein n=1 Tax=Promineifilum sp. TaxID=2664178 RepID=UPI0035AFC060
MAQQVMNDTVTGRPSQKGHGKIVVRVLVAALAVALVLLTINQIRRDTPVSEQAREATLSAPVSAPSQPF